MAVPTRLLYGVHTGLWFVVRIGGIGIIEELDCVLLNWGSQPVQYIYKGLFIVHYVARNLLEYFFHKYNVLNLLQQ